MIVQQSLHDHAPTVGRSSTICWMIVQQMVDDEYFSFKGTIYKREKGKDSG